MQTKRHLSPGSVRQVHAIIRGSLTQAWLQWQGIGSDSPQIFALGVKELWETKRPLDRIVHTLGWPLPT